MIDANTIIVVVLSLGGFSSFRMLLKISKERKRLIAETKTEQLQKQARDELEYVLREEDKKWLEKHEYLYSQGRVDITKPPSLAYKPIYYDQKEVEAKRVKALREQEENNSAAITIQDMMGF